MGKVLFVDDDPNLLAGLRRQFHRRYDIDVAESGKTALDKLQSTGPFAVVVSDMRMPEMDGVEFLAAVAKNHPESIRIMLTGNADQQTAIEAVNQGQIFCFLNKPCESDVLTATLDKALSQFKRRSTERDLLEQSLAGSVKVLLDILRVVNPTAYRRSTLLQPLAARIATDLGVSNIWDIKLATMLASVGYVNVPEALLQKIARGLPLGIEEQNQIDRQPELASDLIAAVPRLGNVARIIRLQDKNFDGTGLPPYDGLFGEDIPLGSRILKVLNAITPMERSCRPSLFILDMLENDGTLYDPAVVMITRSILEESKDLELHEPAGTFGHPLSGLLTDDMAKEDLASPSVTDRPSAEIEWPEHRIAH